MHAIEAVVLFTSTAVVALCFALVLLDLRSRLTAFDGELFALRAPGARGSPEHFFMSLHGLLRPLSRGLVGGQPWISLELAGYAGQVTLRIWIPRGEQAFVNAMLRAAYPGVELERVADPATGASRSFMGEFGLGRGNYLPIRTLFGSEPLASVVSTLSDTEDQVQATLQLLVRPKPSRWQTAAHGTAYRLREGCDGARWIRVTERSARATQFERDRAKAIETKAAGLGFDCVLRVVVAASARREAHALVRSVAASLLPYSDSNGFVLRRFRSDQRSAPLSRTRFPLFGSVLLTADELAVLWHVPADAQGRFDIVGPPKLAPPPRTERGERLLGHSTWRGGNVPIRLSITDSRSHLHLLGSTGTGKTTAMLSLAAQDVAAGRGVAVLDPKGDLVGGLLERVPHDRIDDVVLISPDDGASSVGINPLQLWPGDDRDLVAENVLTIFKRIYERYWGPRTDDVLKAALLTLLHLPGSTLAHVPLLLMDDEYRGRALKAVDDPLGLDQFWRWFDALSDSQRRDSIGPVLNKLRDFLIRPRLRRLLCQPHSTVDVAAVVDGGKILLADLSVGRWGETTAALIGSFLVARIWQAVLARSAMPEADRRDFFLFLDEFQHFLGIAGPFSDALAEARSLRLSLTIANQHLGQLTRELRDAVASNARSRLVFQCGQDDATYLAREFAPLDATALMSLGRFEAAARVVIDGRSSPPFTLRTLVPTAVAHPAAVSEVRATSARRYARPAGEVDEELRASVPSEAVREVEEGYRRRK